MTKIICIEIEKPRNCPYRVKSAFYEQYLDWDCLRTGKKCNNENKFPKRCPLMEGRTE